MERDNQYSGDLSRLSSLISKHTGIPKNRLIEFFNVHSVEQLWACSNLFCETNDQRRKLTALFEFKNLYENVKSGEHTQKYVLNSVEKAGEYLCNHYADIRDSEQVVMLCLDSKLKLIAKVEHSRGAVNTATINARELCKEALFYNAVSVIIAHNHISGVNLPSQEDKDTTARLWTALNSVDIALADHIIVTGSGYTSMAEIGLIGSPSKEALKQVASPVSEGRTGLKPKPQSVREILAAAKKQRTSETARNPQNNIKHNRAAR
jgi:DNA repair protein RadC